MHASIITTVESIVTEKLTQTQQGIAGDTNPLAQDYLVWVNTELGNFMAYNSYMNEETKSLWP